MRTEGLHHICIEGVQASGTMQNTDDTFSNLHRAVTQMLALSVDKVPTLAFLPACTMLLTAYSKHETDHQASQNATRTSLMACSAPSGR